MKLCNSLGLTRVSAAVVGVTALALGGCGGSPTAPDRDQVFYLHEKGVLDKRYSWERYYPPLDHAESKKSPRRVGVAVLDGDVRFAHPIDWYLRTADYTPERRFISYQSPRQFVFSIYERTDPVEVTWDELLTHYEESVAKNGSELLSARVPTSTANAQGRSYFVKTPVPARPDLESFAHEIIVRSSERVLLVQVVHGPEFEDSADEVVHAVRSMLVY
ncbi:MAG: hypothetical protein EXR75_11310 [Myxococcales bacterium]|nr:hypothetical protein [Myxococcales bacterium]